MARLVTVTIMMMGFGLLAWCDVPEAKLPVEKSCFSVEGDLLYWVSQISGLQSNFGSTNVIQSSVNGVSITKIVEKDVDPTYSWAVGYRILTSYQFSNRLWDLSAIWTSFKGTGHKSINYGNWNVTLDQIDTALFYNAYWNSWFITHPFIGVRANKINQTLFSEVIADVIIGNSGLATDTKIFNDKEKYRAIGPLFGINGDVILGYGFELYGGIGVSLLYGSYRLYFKDSEIVTSPATPSNSMSSIKKYMNAFNYSVDLGLGVSWETKAYKWIGVKAKIGIENHQFFNQNHIGAEIGDLSFSGLAFAISLII